MGNSITQIIELIDKEYTIYHYLGFTDYEVELENLVKEIDYKLIKGKSFCTILNNGINIRNIKITITFL